MSAIFLTICVIAVVFYTVLLLECCRPRPTGEKAPVRRVVLGGAVDSAAGQRFLAYLEKEMAESFFVHHRSAMLALLVIALLSAPIAAQGPREQPSDPPSGDTGQPVPPSVQKQLDAMQKSNEALQKRIEQLEAEVSSRGGQAQAVGDVASNFAPAHSVADLNAPAQPRAAESSLQQAAPPPTTGKPDPFSYADWTWLNGTSRVKDLPFDSKFFTPEIRVDTSFIESLNHPQDDTLGGSTEIFRSNEIQLDQISFGGDFHWDNVRARILTMNGMFGLTTPRNDASAGRGQWALRGAYRCVSARLVFTGSGSSPHLPSTAFVIPGCWITMRYSKESCTEGREKYFATCSQPSESRL